MKRPRCVERNSSNFCGEMISRSVSTISVDEHESYDFYVSVNEDGIIVSSSYISRNDKE